MKDNSFVTSKTVIKNLNTKQLFFLTNGDITRKSHSNVISKIAIKVIHI